MGPTAPGIKSCHMGIFHDNEVEANDIVQGGQQVITRSSEMAWQTISGTYTPSGSSLTFGVVFDCTGTATSLFEIHIDNAILRAESPSQVCTTVTVTTSTVSSTLSSTSSTILAVSSASSSATSSIVRLSSGTSTKWSTSSSSKTSSSTISQTSSSTIRPTTSSSSPTSKTSSSNLRSSSSSTVATTSSSSTNTLISSVTASTLSAASSATPSIVQTALSGTCVYSGCYTEATNIRELSKATYVNYTNMSVEICAKNCEGYHFFGVEYSGECYCGDSLGPGSIPAPTTDCNMVCDGHPLEICGAGNRLSLYNCTLPGPASTPTPLAAPAFPAVGKYSYYGCQTEATSTRALSLKATAYDTMTLKSCAADCAGYTFFGTEFGRECYCGDTLNAGSVVASPSDCSMPCAGNSTEFCGSGQRLSLYNIQSGQVAAIVPTVGAYNYNGCYTEGTNLRALASKATAYDTMTLESCAQDCTGYTYFGTEYNRECYCGNSFSAGSVLVADRTCSSPCARNMLEFCGGSKLLTVYKHS